MRTVLIPLLLTLWVYGLLGWLYIALNAVVHPESLSWPLTHFLPFPREDTFGTVCFAVSAISFFVWNIQRAKSNNADTK
jgi:hypothetical protein